MPSAYIIVNVKVTNAVQYEAYKKWSSAAIMRMVVVEAF
jgi:uncharacterized protein (DUF1330 family)